MCLLRRRIKIGGPSGERLRAPPVADTASKKEWQRSSGDPAQPSKAGALGRGRATKCAHVRRKAPNGAKWSLRGREAAVSAAHKFRAPQQEACPYGCGALFGRLIAAPTRVYESASRGRTGSSAPTGAEVFERHARVGVPYDRFVGSAFTAVGRDHWACRFFIRLRSRHLSHSPLVLSP